MKKCELRLEETETNLATIVFSNYMTVYLHMHDSFLKEVINLQQYAQDRLIVTNNNKKKKKIGIGDEVEKPNSHNNECNSQVENVITRCYTLAGEA